LELSTSQTATTIVWPTMYWGVPKNRAARSAARPNVSCPKAPCCSCTGTRLGGATDGGPPSLHLLRFGGKIEGDCPVFIRGVAPRERRAVRVRLQAGRN